MANILAIVFDYLVSAVIPLGALVYFILKKRHLVRPYICGVATFLVFQVITRIPLLQIMATQEWYVRFAGANPILYSVLLGLSAALFEEVGRFIVMKLFMRKNTDFASGVSFGIGHGGLEAVLLVALNYTIALVMVPSTLLAASPSLIFTAGLERLFAMMFHVGASVLVLRGIRLRRPLYLLMAIALHTLLDGSLGILQLWGWTTAQIEIFVGVFGLGMLVYTILAGKKEKQENLQSAEDAAGVSSPSTAASTSSSGS